MADFITGLSKINDDLCSFSMRWVHDGDYLRCRKCKRPQITSAMDLDFPHTERCKAAGTVEPHPWRTYLGLISQLADTARATQAAKQGDQQ